MVCRNIEWPGTNVLNRTHAFTTRLSPCYNVIHGFVLVVYLRARMLFYSIFLFIDDAVGLRAV